MGAFASIWHSLALALNPSLRICCSGGQPVPLPSCLMALSCSAAAALLVLWATGALSPAGRHRALVLSLTIYLVVNLFPLNVGALLWLRRALDERSPLELLVFVAGIAGLVGAYRVARPRSEQGRSVATTAANVFATTLLALTAVTGLRGWITGSEQRAHAVARAITQDNTRSLPVKGPYPDIYYIVLDGYGRADVLRDVYRFDNGGFLRDLERRGFRVAARARSNYQQTYPSLASSLNLTYLDRLATVQPPSRRVMQYLIEHAALVESLKTAGYRVVVFPTHYAATATAPLADVMGDNHAVAPWVPPLVAQTPLWLLPPVRRVQHEQHRRTVIETLERLPELSDVPRPRFVFAHVLSPHPPFVLGADPTPAQPYMINDGSHFPGSRADYLTGYASQVRRLNPLLQRMLDRLLVPTRPAPVVILQGDHGPGSTLDWSSFDSTDHRERSGILAAYLVPDAVKARLYDEVTPVNAWRIILRGALGADYDTLPDASYYAPWTQPFEFQQAPDESAAPGNTGRGTTGSVADRSTRR